MSDSAWLLRECEFCLEDSSMTVEQLIFVGLNGTAIALDRETGEIVWSNSEMKVATLRCSWSFDRLIVSTNGYIYCLDPLNRPRLLWHNPLRGYGLAAPTSLISVRGQKLADCHRTSGRCSRGRLPPRLHIDAILARFRCHWAIRYSIGNNDSATTGANHRDVHQVPEAASMPDLLKARAASLSPRQRQIVRLTSLG